MTGYCFKCKGKRELVGAVEVTLKNKRRAMRGVWLGGLSVCGEMIVVLLQNYKQLPCGAEGIIYDSTHGGWVAVFCGVTVLLPFEGKDIIFRLL